MPNFERDPNMYPGQRSPESMQHIEGGVRSEALLNREAAVEGVLIGKEQALQEHGINGDILGMITLPEEDPETGEKVAGKQIAIVDFGEDYRDKSLVYYQDESDNHQPSSIFGKPKTRFGLLGIYIPDEMANRTPYVPLEIGETKIGRREESTSYPLGLRDSDPGGNEYISRSHFTVSLGEDGRIIVRDHSTNGTGLDVAAPEAIEGNYAQESPETQTVPQVETPQTQPISNEIISHVPTSEELAASKVDAEQAEHAKREEKINEIQQKMEELESSFSQDVRMNLWRYATGVINKAEAQREGKGQESINASQQAGQAWRELPKGAQSVADEYIKLMKQKERLY